MFYKVSEDLGSNYVMKFCLLLLQVIISLNIGESMRLYYTFIRT
jgi:hypothetical protein